MKTAVFLLALFAAVLGAPDSRIYYGNPASPGQFPYQVSMWRGCGGSLIHPKWVVTAKHCVDSESAENADPKYVVFGAHYLSEWEENRVVINAKDVFQNDDHDIALIELESEAPLRDDIQVIPIATGSDTYAGEDAVESGWGENNAGIYFGVLNYVNLRITDPSVCGDAYLICTVGRDHELAGPCFGDSGGPLVSLRTGELIGVANWIQAYCGSGLPSGFARVTAHVSWIESVTGLDFRANKD